MSNCEVSCPVVNLCQAQIDRAVSKEQEFQAFEMEENGDYNVPARVAISSLDKLVRQATEGVRGIIFPLVGHEIDYSRAKAARTRTLAGCEAEGPREHRRFRFFGKVARECQSLDPSMPKGVIPPSAY